MHKSSSVLLVSPMLCPAYTSSPRCVSICGSRIADSWNTGQTLLHSPQLTQLSARAAAVCGPVSRRGPLTLGGPTAAPGREAAKVAPTAAGSPRPNAGPRKEARGLRAARTSPAKGEPSMARSMATPGTNVARMSAPGTPRSSRPNSTPRLTTDVGSSRRLMAARRRPASPPNLRLK